MNKRICSVVSPAVAFLLLCGVSAAGDLTEKLDKTFRLRSGGRFELRNTNGAVHVNTWDREEVRIEAEKRVHGGSRQEAERLLKETEIRIDAADDYVRVDTDTPRSNGGSFWHWLFDGGSADIQVIYWITLPRRAVVRLSNTNGRVEVREVAGECEVKTTNGRIVMLGMAGGASAHTTNGSIELRLLELLGAHDFDLKTTNGGITAELPENFSGWISAQTTNGSIQSSFPVTVERGYSKNRLEGKVGDGGSRFRAETTNGSIKLLKL
jgi:DUF4097 and DUF4098 domain-containing protein YvlB